jgi:cation transport ATPase
MTGDGVNDAAALATVDLGLRNYNWSGNRLAMETADNVDLMDLSKNGTKLMADN